MSPKWTKCASIVDVHINHKTFIMDINDLRLMIIENFILCYTSDDAERESMIQYAADYVSENESEIDLEGLKSITEG